ncbi:MAG: PLxRFG domain-containing protein [Dechloromonas sp.]|nr:PLxRFG domain-containing protein [Dechloromonas sp.]
MPEAQPPVQRDGFPRLYGTPSERDPRSPLIPPAETLKEQYGIKQTKKVNKLREAELGRLAALINQGAVPADAIAERMDWVKRGAMDAVRQANDVDEQNFVTGLDPEQQVAYMVEQLPTQMQDVLRLSAMGVRDADIAAQFEQNDKQWAQKRRTAAAAALAETAQRLGLDATAVREALSARPASAVPSDTTRAASLADLQEQYTKEGLTDEQRAEIESQIRQLTQDRAGMTAQDAANLGIAQDITEGGTSTGFQVINAGADLGSLERAAQDPADLVEFRADNSDLTAREVDENSGALLAAKATYDAWRGAGDPEWSAWGPQQKQRWMKLDQAAENLDINQAAFDRAGVEMLDEAEQGNFYTRQPYFGMELSTRDAGGNLWSYRYMNFARYPRVLDAMRRLLVSPAGHAYDQISGVYLSENTGADAFVVPEGDGMYRLVLTQDFLARATDDDLNRTINHEAAHIADDAAGSAYYSGDTAWAEIVDVVRERFNGGPADMTTRLRSFLRYPLADESVTPEAVNSEVFAQLWAAHLDPGLRAFVQQQLPEAHAYVETMYADYSRVGSRVEAGAGTQVQGAGTEGTGGQQGEARPTADVGGDGPRGEGRTEGVRFAATPWSERETNSKYGREDTLRSLYFRLQDVYDEAYSPSEAFETAMEELTPQARRLLRELQNNDLLGFDYPHQALQALIEDPDSYDISPGLKRVISTFGNKYVRFSKPAQATAVESTLKEVLVPAARRTVAGYARKANYALLFGHQLVDRIGAMLPSARSFFRTLQDRITVRDRREARVMEIADRFYRLDQAEQARANRFIYESTFNQKWGYTPEWDRSAPVDAGMAAQFNALSEDAQLAVKQVFAYGNETQREYEQVLLRTKGAEVMTQLAEAEAAGDEKRIAALKKEQEKLTRENGALKTMLAGPYAPLKRFGRHAVVVRSQAFMDAEAAGEGARVEEMQSDPDHYQVMFVDSVFEREKKAVELQREFPDRNVVGFEREPESTRATELPLQAIKRLQEAIVTGPNGEKLSERSKRILGRIASDLYVASLDSLSARQTQQRRRNIHGANEDMMRAFVSQGRGMAHMLATLEVNGPMQESLQKMRTEARTGRTAEKADALNEVLNRYTLLMETRPTPFQDGAMATTSLWMLLTNPAYWFGNATQPFMMSLPVLAGRHNAGASWSAVLQGYRDTMPALEGRALDPRKLKSIVGREADAVQELLDRGHIDLTLEREMGEISETSWHTGHKIMGMLRWIPQRVEVTNRVATALAAYRLEYVRATGQGVDAATAHGLATEYADQIILDTHGDYSAAGAPRVLMQGSTQLPIKLMGQFRKFQLVQLGLMAKLIRQSFADGMSPDERTAARWSLAWMLGTYLTMTGLTGVIGANVVWGILSAFGDDDEKDLDLVLTRALGDRDAAILLTRGVPALLGMDVSQRLGMGNVLSLFPYADTEPAVKDSYTNYLMAATGPFLGGLLPRAASGVDYINQGDYWKGLELLVPNGLTNAMRAMRYAGEGYSNRKGDLLMSPDEIGVVSEIFQAVGLPTTVLTDRQWKAGVLYELEQTMRADATRIKRQYTEAARSRDTETMAELRGEWRQLQEMRARNGMKPQPLSSLLKAPQQQREREDLADEGVAMTKATAGFTGTVPD